MDETTFWDLIGRLDWSAAPDDDKVVAPVVEALAEMQVEAIQGFEDRLAEKLHALDTRAHACEIGEDAFKSEDEHFSLDMFLYSRCCVVANGQDVYAAVLAKPSEFPKDVEFEPLLYVASEAYEKKMGEEWDYSAPVTYETFGNKAAWRGPSA
jgi:hypothetical protein